MSRYQALTNLSVPRPDNQSDLVPYGGTVELDDATAQLFLQRQPPVIRKVGAKDPGPLPVLVPRALFGSQRGLPGPPQDARPDPAGSTTIQVLENIPEANAPQAEPPPAPGSTAAVVDAMDLPPRAARAGTR
jgi:hypothetical protein